VEVPPVTMGVRGGAGCGYEERCSAVTCANAKENLFCMDANCSFAGACGKALREHPSLVITRSSVTGMRGLIAKAAIPAGEVLGEYLGHLDLFGPPCRNGPVNGYRMHLKTRTSGKKCVGIDALEMGAPLRMMNHACNPCARFHEVQTGRHLTVVAVTVRDVQAGEQVTVSYGDRMWFICKCGWSGCQHRDLQDIPRLQ
jgi:SET domain-containing protein